MSASQAERRRFEPGHPLQQSSPGLDELQDLRAHAAGPTLTIESAQNVPGRLRHKAIDRGGFRSGFESGGLFEKVVSLDRNSSG
jgi:hypothetical protein